jgi:hypothetical protein
VGSPGLLDLDACDSEAYTILPLFHAERHSIFVFQKSVEGQLHGVQLGVLASSHDAGAFTCVEPKTPM